MITLTAKTLTSKIAKQEIRAMFPETSFLYKKHVAGVGYVIFVKDGKHNILAKVFKQDGLLKVAV